MRGGRLSVLKSRISKFLPTDMKKYELFSPWGSIAAWLCCLAFLYPNARAAATSSNEGVMPLSPADLLRLLPACPVNWKITVSRGLNELTSLPGLKSIAIRQYRFDPPADVSQSNTGKTAPDSPVTTCVTLVDAGGDPDLFGEFRSFSPTVSRAGMHHYEINGCQVIEGTKDSRTIFTISIPPRFLLVATLENQPEKDCREWLALLRIPELVASSRAAPKNPLPERNFPIVYVDELNPKANKTTTATIMTRNETNQMSDRWKEAQKQGPPVEPK